MKGIKYINKACGFDIEVSSFTDKESGDIVGLPYLWTIRVEDEEYIGYDIHDAVDALKVISECNHCDYNNRLVIYVHNLSYEFQFLKDLMKWDDVFAMEKRKVVSAVSNGIEFRCSYILSGKSLEELGEEVGAPKLIDTVDYSLIRTPETPLTPEEIKYNRRDVDILVRYIRKKISEDGGIDKIPQTKTAYVRNDMRNACLKKGSSYAKNMSKLTLDKKQFVMAERAFLGGFVHANPLLCGDVIKNVRSFDFTSSYPAVMLSENKFPMSAPKQVEVLNKKDFRECIDNYACIFNVKFFNIRRRSNVYDDYITGHCVMEVKEPKYYNGRIFRASYLEITTTDVDFDIIERVYEWDGMIVYNMLTFNRGFLPIEIRDTVRKYYKTKQALKNVSGRENDYIRAKENLNATYGMMVTKIDRPDISYNGEWEESEKNTERSLAKYNKSGSKFLYYPWGVFITALARHNLWMGILECGEDYIYSDTDSIKIKNPEKHQYFFDKYNTKIRNRLKKIYHGNDLSGLGEWDNDGNYEKFKTLGAKRYMYYGTDNKNDTPHLSVAVSGCSKEKLTGFMSKYEDPFRAFNCEMWVPSEFTGKLIHSYIDDVSEGEIEDYLGNTYHYYVESCVHLAPTDYSFNPMDEFFGYILGRKDIK